MAKYIQDNGNKDKNAAKEHGALLMAVNIKANGFIINSMARENTHINRIVMKAILITH
jgi:hypothetical protein